MKKAFRIGITIVICVGLVCGYYYYLSHKNAKSAEDAQDKTTEVERSSKGTLIKSILKHHARS